MRDFLYWEQDLPRSSADLILQFAMFARDVPYIQYGREEQLKSQSINISELLLDVRHRHPKVVILIIDACRPARI
jgi:hypothetical protein